MTDPEEELEPDVDVEPSIDIVKMVVGVVYMAALSYASYAAVKHADMIEIRLRGLHQRFRDQWRQAREWRAARNRVLFEAHYITREAAANGER